MKLNSHEQGRPNVAGLTSPEQQAELKLLLTGRWPPLKPLPVFKYETDEYRASIDFDKTRGEWVCRKTSLPSNKVQERRGGLAEITMALPQARAEVFAEGAAAEPQEQELGKDAIRRLHVLVEWRENYENGALYSGLQNYLSESERDEIEDSIRLTLTARQLQFNPKNVAYVFDALSKAGGKLATLIEIAQRNKTEQGGDATAKVEAVAFDVKRHAPVEEIHGMHDRRLQMRTTPASLACVEFGGANGGIVLNMSETGMAVATANPLAMADRLPRLRFQLPGAEMSIEISAQIVWLAESKKSAGLQFVDLTAEARNQISNWIASERSSPKLESVTPVPVESLLPASQESSPEKLMGSVFPGQEQPHSAGLIARMPFQASKIVTSENLDANQPSFAEDFQKRVHYHARIAGNGPQVRKGRVESSPDRIENSHSRSSVLEISGLQVGAVVFLLVVISLAVALTVGRDLLGKRPQIAEKSTPAVGAIPPALVNRPDETTSRTSTSPAASQQTTPMAGLRSEVPSAESVNIRPEDSATRVGPINSSSAIGTRSRKDSNDPEAIPERESSTRLIARNAPPLAKSQPAHPGRGVGPIRGELASPAPRRAMAALRAAPRVSTPSTILVSGPGDGSKPFRVVLPEEPIAASSSFAMTSQLSVLVSPEPAMAPAQNPARLQAAQLVSFVWPRYPRPGDRHGSSETVKVRTTIGERGEVLDVKHLSGSTSLLPAAVIAIRQWRYQPTLLNKTPVQAQQDVTIEFRPAQNFARMPTRPSSRN